MKAAHIAATFALAMVGAAGVASAVSLNPKGLGQALIYPYYTVNKSQDTLVSLVNTSDVGTVAHVSFREGHNGRPVLDFNVFLSAHDVWRAAVSQLSDDGGARIVTRDRSCVYPVRDASGNDMRDNGIPFSAAVYSGRGGYPTDGGPTSITRTREGYIEIIALGDVIPGSPTDRRITHVSNGIPNGGAPAGCNELGNTFVSDLVTPTNGLSGTGSIINVGEGTLFAYNANALSGFTASPLILPGGETPTLQHANSTESRAGGAVAYLSNEAGAPLALDYARGIDAVSAVFMADAIHNEAILTASLGANTDWILTFPTKSHYVDTMTQPNAPMAPFTRPFASPGEAPVTIYYSLYDQEELWVSDPCGFMCGVPPRQPFTIPYAVNAIAFNQWADSTQPESGVFGSTLLQHLDATFDNWEAGWAKLTPAREHALPGGKTADGAEVTLNGLPVTGFMAYNVVNNNAQPGKLANFSGLFPHRTSVSCSAKKLAPGTQDPCS